MDQFAEPSPGITGTEKNPLKDVRVRTAISMAINREAIVERIMNGVAVPAGELLPQGFFGTPPGAAAEQYAHEGAKKPLGSAACRQRECQTVEISVVGASLQKTQST